MSERGAIGNFFRDEDGRGSHLFRINTFDIKTLLHTFQSTLNIRDKNDGFANVTVNPSLNLPVIIGGVANQIQTEISSYLLFWKTSPLSELNP